MPHPLNTEALPSERKVMLASIAECLAVLSQVVLDDARAEAPPRALIKRLEIIRDQASSLAILSKLTGSKEEKDQASEYAEDFTSHRLPAVLRRQAS